MKSCLGCGELYSPQEIEPEIKCEDMCGTCNQFVSYQNKQEVGSLFDRLPEDCYEEQEVEC